MIHGLTDRVMTCAQIMSEAKYASNSLSHEEIGDRMRVARPGLVYFLRAGNDPVFFPGMSAEVVLR